MASAKCATSGSHPITSGAFDYCSWVIKEVLSEAECEKLAKAPFTYMDLCAGMGTSIISVEAVRRALAERGVTLRSTCIALAGSIAQAFVAPVWQPTSAGRLQEQCSLGC